MLFATLISRCAKDIDTLIESLPSEESSTELQVQSLRRLEAENKEAAEQLEEVKHCFILLLVSRLLWTCLIHCCILITQTIYMYNIFIICNTILLNSRHVEYTACIIQ